MSAEDPDERSENERFYDDEIAHKLREVAALCKDRNMPMVAFVWFDNDEAFGQTGAMARDDVPAWLVTTLAHWLMGFPEPPAPRPVAEG